MSDSPASLRRPILFLTIGSFSLAALMGVLALVAGGGFGELETKVLLTTLVVGSASVCVLCYLATSETAYAVVGAVGGAAAVATTLVALVLVWSSWENYGPPDEVVRGFGIGVVVSLSLAQACMLLGVAGRRSSTSGLLALTLALVGIMALLLTGVILSEPESDGVWRLIGVVAILDVLGTVVTVAVAKFGGGAEPPRGVVLSGRLAGALDERARAEGRPPTAVLEDAVERYLRGSE
jgi:hypothetical protein